MKQDSIPVAIITAFLAASQLAFSMPASEARPAPVRNSALAEPSDQDQISEPRKAVRR